MDRLEKVFGYLFAIIMSILFISVVATVVACGYDLMQQANFNRAAEDRGALERNGSVSVREVIFHGARYHVFETAHGVAAVRVDR